jgi:hypothetical protein
MVNRVSGRSLYYHWFYIGSCFIWFDEVYGVPFDVPRARAKAKCNMFYRNRWWILNFTTYRLNKLLENFERMKIED